MGKAVLLLRGDKRFTLKRALLSYLRRNVLSFVSDVQDPIKASKSYRGAGKRNKGRGYKATALLLDRGSTFLRPNFSLYGWKKFDLTFFTDVVPPSSILACSSLARWDNPHLYTCASHRVTYTYGHVWRDYVASDVQNMCVDREKLFGLNCR